MRLTILVGTMTGTAQLVAQELELTHADDGLAVEARAMDHLTASALSAGGAYLICTSTYGQGDVPDNARTLYESLRAERPDLSSVRYGVIALGDRTYADTFCFGGKRFDALLQELGARRVGEVMLHDASGGTLPEDDALSWAESWVPQIREAAGS